jgi:hypothetical protein
MTSQNNNKDLCPLKRANIAKPQVKLLVSNKMVSVNTNGKVAKSRTEGPPKVLWRSTANVAKSMANKKQSLIK